MKLFHVASFASLCALSMSPLNLNAETGKVPEPSAEAGSIQPYVWKSVRMGGCGFVSGIVFHPTEPGLVYCRTDMGGAYRRDGAKGEWIPLLDWIGHDDFNLFGVESIALDPSDPDRVYMACGTNSGAEFKQEGAIVRSTDRGNTFDVIRVPFSFGANENGRGNGERMAVDPRNGAILLLGTRWDGLQRSDDYGSTWRRVDSFPDMAEDAPADLNDMMARDSWLKWSAGSGIIRVIFAPESADPDRSDTIYVAASLMGRNSLFVSHDAGVTWEPVPGQPTKLRPTDLDLGPDGVLYVSYGTCPGPFAMTDGAVWRYDTKSGVWTDITPDQPGRNPGVEHNLFGYCSVAVDPERPGVVMAVPFWYVGGEDIFRSLDGGQTWKPIIRTCGNWDYSKIPYSRVPHIHWLFDVEVNPFDSDQLMFVTGYGCMETYDLTKTDTAQSPADGNTWMPAMTGIEESVPLDMISPKEGPLLVVGIGDYGGFVYDDPDVFPPEGAFANPRFNNCTGLAQATLNQKKFVRVGKAWKGMGGNIAFSDDGARNWQSGGNIDEKSRNGMVALSADGSTCVWTPESVRKPENWMQILKVYKPHYSTDRGATWAECGDLPEGVRVTADPVNPLEFYALDVFRRTLYRSTDGARSFQAERLSLPGAVPVRERLRGDSRAGQDRVYCTPGREGDLWLALFDGLYHIQPDGSFLHMPHVDELLAMGFGKGAPGADCNAIFLIGVVDGVQGIFRSDDNGEHYVRINDDAHQWATLLLITGDPNRYGRVYVGTHGRGAVYGDIAAEPAGGKVK